MNNQLAKDMTKVLIIIGLSIALLFAISSIGCVKVPGIPPKPSQCKVSVIAFVSSYCGPCKHAKRILVSIKTPDVYVLILDIHEYPELAKKFKVTSVPTFFIRVGNEIEVTRTQDIFVVVRIVRENL